MKAAPADSLEESPEIPDVDLVAPAKAGALSAFESLVRRRERAVDSLARRARSNEQDAKEVTPQALPNALEHLAGFRA